jgi:hypothetical protein
MISQLTGVVTSALDTGFGQLETDFLSKVNKEISNEFERFNGLLLFNPLKHLFTPKAH